MSDYKKTLNLPETSFPMKANLTQREPEMLRQWEEKDAYGAMVAASGAKGSFVLHDGPPYANGHLHLGHALNKILKDIILKSRNMQGIRSEFVPGWDCHGLPIELQVEHQVGEQKQKMSVGDFRRLCREYAAKWIDIQREEFKRLGVFGTWSTPYVSMDSKYEATTARELARFMESGSVVRSKKSIYWCCSCRTALAEAEVEYKEHKSPSIYVRFPVNDPKLTQRLPKAVPGHTWFVIWTTTPWTIPDNMAIALHPEFDYALVEVDGEYYIVAEKLMENCRKLFGWVDPVAVSVCKGADLEGLVATHPFYDRPSPVVLGAHVTLEAGTGCVHTAPGHGREDYDVGIKYGLDIYSPIDDSGRFLSTEPLFGGKTVVEANPLVIDKLMEVGNLLTSGKITHSYPHCWRCKEPVIFRATKQWFISMEKNNLRQRALDAIRHDVRWIPAWGEDRIYAMIENRPDWCISRQRSWGVPIAALICEDCGETWWDAAWNAEIIKRYAEYPTGCDYWFDAPLEEVVPANLTCSCGSTHWRKEKDILDVWFDSGTSFAAVVEQRKECHFPADMYLEGSDQHRGWFHSSLLAAIGGRHRAPYKSVLTHGYVLDGEGKKMSKSVGNIIAPEQVIKKYGAEILRMWVSSVEYREDMRISDEILNRQVDAYRRIRNTCRYLIGNLYDFTPADAIADDKLDPLDRYAFSVVSKAHAEVQQAYQDFEFHKVFHILHNLCVTDLSAFYLDVLKDRLYASAPGSQERRSAQTVLWRILLLLITDMAPILSFTSEEVFMSLPAGLRPDFPTVFAMNMDQLKTLELAASEQKRWERLLDIRAEVTRAIEPLRKAGEIGHSLDTAVTLHVNKELYEVLTQLKTDMRATFLVSQLVIDQTDTMPAGALATDLEGLSITIAKAAGEKCERCWIYSTDLGSDSNHPTLCPRCTGVMKGL